jgi:peroxiredoxin (alkyl hydroperoxide reductase subunit C)
MTILNLKEKTAGIQLMDRAPDFCAPAYHQGQETEICLSSYVGKWLLIFFYSSDFSFV